jgi:flagellar biosynthesis/type III secretory pathway M-ring protein FliF/YscJ
MGPLELFYDPTLEFLFVPAEPPSGTALQPGLVAEIQNTNTAIAASVSVAAILVVAVIITVVVIVRRRKEDERAKMKAVLDRQGAQKEGARSTSASVSQSNGSTHAAPAASAPVEQQQRKWRPSTTTGVALRNTQTDE